MPVHTIDRYEKGLRRPENGGERQKYFLAKKSGNLIGYGILDYREADYNDISFASSYIFVKKAFRHKKVAKQILRSILRSIPDFINTISFEVRKGVKEIRFLKQQLNSNLAFTIRYSVSKIREFKIDDVKLKIKIRESEIQKKGYSIFYVDGKNFTSIAEEFAPCIEIIWNMVPRFDSTKKDEEFPTERVLGRIDFFHEHDGELYTFFARAQDNSIIGFSELLLYKSNPKTAFQMLTGVIPDHRGNGLGYLLKLKLLEFLIKNSEAEFWFTGNAYGNEHMLKINQLLKYEDWVEHESWEVNRQNWEKYLEINS